MAEALSHIVLPIGPERSECIEAVDEFGEAVVKEIALLLRLEVFKGRCGQDVPAVRVGNAEPEAADGYVPWEKPYVFIGIIYCKEDCCAHYVRVKKKILEDRLLLQQAIRRAMLLAICRCVLQEDLFLMHGAALLCPWNQRAIILFGESGVGKSTCSRRFLSQGGDFLSDDMFMLRFTAEGECFVQPLPTMSGFDVYDISVNFSKSVQVVGAYQLYRGEDDRIEAADPIQWRLWLSSSLNNFLVYPIKWLPAEFHRQLFMKQLGGVAKIHKAFGQKMILGDLEGHIFEHVKNDTQA